MLAILAMTCIMSAMAGLGAIPFFFVGKLKDSWAGGLLWYLQDGAVCQSAVIPVVAAVYHEDSCNPNPICMQLLPAGLANAVASGVMLTASFDLLHEVGTFLHVPSLNLLQCCSRMHIYVAWLCLELAALD